MRHWIQILENASFDLYTEFRDIAWDAFEGNVSENESELEDYVFDYEDETGEQVQYPKGRRNERAVELLDPAFAQWCREKVGERVDWLASDILSKAKGGMLTCWRAIEAPPNWKPRGHIGIHWSRNESKAQPIFAELKPGYKTYRVKANIPLSSIDWDRTVKANLSEEFGIDEDEITLKPNGPYTIVSVTVIG